MNPWLFDRINGWAGTPGWDPVMRFCAEKLIAVTFLALVVVLVAAVRAGRRADVMTTVAALAVGFGLNRLVAVLHPDARPFQVRPTHLLIAHPPGQAFPSDHATAAFTVAFALGAVFSRRLGGALTLVAVLVGFARVYCGLHDPADIAAGAVVGALAVTATVTARRALASHALPTGPGQARPAA